MGSFKKYVHWKLLIFDLLPPCSSLFILHAGYFWNFEWKIGEWKERKELFFCKLNVKDDNVFYTDIYTITTCIKKVLKNAYVFLIKRLATTKHLLEGTLFAVWKIRQFFSQSEHRDRLNPSPPLPLFVFICSLRTSLSPSTTNPLLKRVRWKRWKELMIMLVHSCI